MCVCEGYYSLSGQGKCTSCPAGYFAGSLASDSCSGQCPKGKYSEKAEKQCTSCPAGKVGTQVGLPSLSKCTDCPKGTFSGTAGLDTCRACPIGKFSKGDTGNPTCTVCNSRERKYQDEINQESCKVCCYHICCYIYIVHVTF